MRYYDVTLPIRDGMPVYPGDPPVLLRPHSAMAKGDPFNVSVLTFGSHTGTHIDAPRHFFEGAGDVAAIRIESLIGPARLIEVPTAGDIEAEALREIPGAPCRRLLLKTRNSARPLADRYASGYAALTPAAARLLADAGLSLVGLDGPSADPSQAPGFPAHRALLGAGMVILEGLDLAAVPPGEYELLCLPLRLADADGAPARVLLRQMGD